MLTVVDIAVCGSLLPCMTAVLSISPPKRASTAAESQPPANWTSRLAALVALMTRRRRAIVEDSATRRPACATLTEMTAAAALELRARNTRPRDSGPNRATRRRSRQAGRGRCPRSRVPAATTDGFDMRRGLLFLNNRYHDPTLGAFVSVTLAR